MKTYLRILSYARPLAQFLPQYVAFTLLGIIFGLMNFTLLKPLFDVLFEQGGTNDPSKFAEKPDFSFSFDGLNDLFNHHLYNLVGETDKVSALGYVCLAIIISVFLANLFVYLANVILAQVRAKVVRNIRMGIYDQVSKLHIGYFTNERKGDLMSRITNDVQQVENTIVQSLRVVFRDPATIIIYFIALFSMSVKLTLFSLVILPIIGTIISEITKRLKKKAVESQESLGRIVNFLDETLGGMRVIKAFTARGYITSKFEEEVAKYSRIDVSMARKNESASPLSQLMGVMVVAGILFYGGTLVLQENESALAASSFITYIIIFSQILTPAKAVSHAISGIQRGLASAERIFAVIDTVPDIQDPLNPKPLTAFNDKISFKDLSFAYDEEVVLKNINLEIEKGKTIALVGPSGGGKSTLADLVPRFYDPTKGEVLIDCISLKDYKTEDIRKIMGIVTQESILFNDTIFKNIAFGLPEAKMEDVIQAAKIANAHDFISEMSDGYKTEIGERGTKLSGGQRQRLSIARAVLKNPPILILDEATSALDSESEKLVQEALTNLMKNRTSIVIAHRLSTIQHADEILVIQKGQIIERGSHESLVAKDGLYKKLTAMQSV